MAIPALPTAPRATGAAARGPASEREPVGELRFRVHLPHAELGYFRECTGLAMEVEVKEYSEGGANGYVHKLPTRVKYPNLQLKRGVTNSPALMEWAQKTTQGAQRVELTVSLMAPDDTVVQRWAAVDAYPVKWTGPSLNASSNQLATEVLEIVHAGLRIP